MIPKIMEDFLHERLPERTWQNRLVREDGQCFMEFSSMDVERLGRLGIQPDRLGPKLVACIWDDESPLEIGGYLVIDNLAMGRPAMGGVRMLPGLTPLEIFNRARGMTLKNSAANLPYGGGKAGIVIPTAYTDPSFPLEDRNEILRRFARLLSRYTDVFLPGPDVGTYDADMKIIAVENGLDTALSKPGEMGGVRLSILGAAGGGLAIALQALLEEMPRLRSLPQFAALKIPLADEITVMIQGFGTVGSHTARILCDKFPSVRVVGISDTSGYIFDPQGLPVCDLFPQSQQQHRLCLGYYRQVIDPHSPASPLGTKFSNQPDDLLRENAFCFIPAAPIANYLDTEPASSPTITVNRMGDWALIIEGANITSQDPEHKAARMRMEREIYRQQGIMIAVDYLVNSGGVIYAAQEHLIRTPAHLRIPDENLGNPIAVEHWLEEHQAELQELAEKRRLAGEAARDTVIRRNMRELVDLLVSDPDMLPSEAAEIISIRRITLREKARTAKDLMERIITLPETYSIREAAQLLVETSCPMLAVINSEETLVGVVTDWDITCASANGLAWEKPISTVMTREVITAVPQDTLLELVRKLEHHEVSAMPVVKDQRVLGMISTDVLARRSLYPLLISQEKL
jgi:glutamate dehydrogenase/leucine dehydrogenase/predicted transcriptional regulator